MRVEQDHVEVTARPALTAGSHSPGSTQCNADEDERNAKTLPTRRLAKRGCHSPRRKRVGAV